MKGIFFLFSAERNVTLQLVNKALFLEPLTLRAQGEAALSAIMPYILYLQIW